MGTAVKIILILLILGIIGAVIYFTQFSTLSETTQQATPPPSTPQPPSTPPPPAATPSSPPAATPSSPPAATPSSPPAATPSSPPAATPSSPPAATPPPPPSVKTDAVCRGEIKDDYYVFDKEPKLGSDIIKSLKEKFSFIKNYIKHFLIKENFVLSPGITSDTSSLDLTKYYSLGTVNTSNILSEPKNGGINNCPIYPTTVYKQTPNTGWMNIKVSDNAYIPARIGINGYLECMSSNAQDCYWKGTSGEVNSLINNPPSTATKPIVCRADGTNNKGHWCYIGLKQLNSSSPLLPI